MAHEVFICYASQDKAVAEAVCDELESREIGCWIAPRDVLPGMEWAETIVDAIDSSRALVLVLSNQSNISPQVIREVGRAAGKGIPIIPLRIDDVTLSKAMDYFISRHHWLDAQTGVQERHLKRLTETVQKILAQKGAPPTAMEKAEAEEKAKQEAEKARKEAEEKAKREAELAAKEKAKREAEEAKERAREEAEKAAKDKAKREAEEAKKAEKAWGKALKEAEKADKEKAKREAAEAREAKEAKKAKRKRPEPVKAGKPLIKQWWLWAGATVVVAVIPLIVILSGGGGEEPPPGDEAPPGETQETPPDNGVIVPLAKENILIGAARPLSGDNAIFDEIFGPIYRMWVDEVNAAGGIYVADYGQQLPLELLIYDDTSDIDTMERLNQKLIGEDKVDILFSAASEAFVEAQVPIANEHGYVLITAEGGNTDIKDMLPGLPYVFATLPFSEWYQLPVLADMLAAKGAETAYIVRVDDAHGAEYSGVAVMEFARVGIDIVGSVGVPISQEDFWPIIETAKAADPDVFCVFAYPGTVLACTSVSMAQGFNPDAFVVGPGGNFGFYPTLFSDDVSAVDGVLTFAAANQKTSAEFAELFADLEEVIGADNLDYWGQPFYRSIVQIWQQAIESTGTLDQDVLRDYIAISTFDTILGPTWFTILGDGGGLLAYECHPGEIGQWQNGVLEIVGGGDWSRTTLTADFIYPKPYWPR
jgi:ABC-type branched-subunit amino acid transport system substrate-binding protein